MSLIQSAVYTLKIWVFTLSLPAIIIETYVHVNVHDGIRIADLMNSILINMFMSVIASLPLWIIFLLIVKFLYDIEMFYNFKKLLLSIIGLALLNLYMYLWVVFYDVPFIYHLPGYNVFFIIGIYFFSSKANPKEE